MFLTLLASAKLQQFDRPLYESLQPPLFPDISSGLARFWSEKSADQIASAMKISIEKAEEVRIWFAQFQSPEQVQAAVSVYNGPAYTSLNPFDFSQEERERCRRQLIILSGLYGAVHADTAIGPYRLEIGISEKIPPHKNLYSLWKPLITDYLAKYCHNQGITYLINCASGEYAKVVDFKKIPVPVITADFREIKEGRAVSVSSFAKQARGAMVRWIIQNNPKDSADLQQFRENGYSFSPEISTPGHYCFVRQQHF